MPITATSKKMIESIKTAGTIRATWAGEDDKDGEYLKPNLHKFYVFSIPSPLRKNLCSCSLT